MSLEKKNLCLYGILQRVNDTKFLYVLFAGKDVGKKVQKNQISGYVRILADLLMQTKK